MLGTVQVSSDLIGGGRMDRYLDECGGDASLATDLFRWNLAASGATFEAIHLVEIVLRNAIDRELRAWSRSVGADQNWLLNPHPYIAAQLSTADLTAAQRRAKKVAAEKGRPRVHDDVLAQMTFGAWRYLLPSKASAGKRKLWEVAISKAFPLWMGTWEPLVDRVVLIHETRNRVAHLEPLHATDLRQVRRSIREVCHATSWSAGRIFTETDRLLPIIESLPI